MREPKLLSRPSAVTQPRAARRRARAPLACATAGALALLLAGCTGGTPWGATPQRIEIPVPDLSKAPEVFDGVSGSTAGSQRVAQRVRSAIAAQPSLAGLPLQIEGLEGGLIVLSGNVPSGNERHLALQTARQVTGVTNVVDRLTGP